MVIISLKVDLETARGKLHEEAVINDEGTKVTLRDHSAKLRSEPEKKHPFLWKMYNSNFPEGTPIEVSSAEGARGRLVQSVLREMCETVDGVKSLIENKDVVTDVHRVHGLG